LTLFNKVNSDHVAVFGNLGSMGGIRSLEHNRCHIATSHLLQEKNEEYNFDFAGKELGELPAVVNFCRREQGLLVRRGNPLHIHSIQDLAQPDLRLANRPLGTGTRLLLDRELIKVKIPGEKILGYNREFAKP
jgi:molybdate-binding protein